MTSLSRIYISGLGAVGAMYSGKLIDMDPNCLKVIASEERIRRYTENGVTINGRPYPFEYVRPEDGDHSADLIIIAVKQHHLEQSINDISRFVGGNTIILSLLNGITSEEIIGQRFGMDKVLYAFCVGNDTMREGTHIRYTNIGSIVFGEKTNKELSEKVTRVKELFDRAGIPYVIPEDMLREQWWKFMLNVGINQVSAVLRAPYRVFQEVPEAMELLFMASREVIQLSRKLGINLGEDDLEKCVPIIKRLDPKGKTSMLQDVEAGRKTEVEIFDGTVVELGRNYGVDTPVNDMLYRMIRALEKSYLA